MKRRALLTFSYLWIALQPTFISANLPNWSFEPGPDLNTAMGKLLLEINADIPCMPCISDLLLGVKQQKFRPDFGPIPWRMRLTPNSVKILFIGQDGTHIAEAAGRPATASFGGRAQNMADYFGVNESAAFINTYAFTIQGQYGGYNTPFLRNNSSTILFSNLVDNKLWLLSQDLVSPVAQWRNRLIDWIIRNNSQSLKLIVTFGGAAADAISTFVESRQGKVGTKFSESDMANIQVPETKIERAGSNKTFPVPLGFDGKDLYETLLESNLDYSNKKVQQRVMMAISKERTGDFVPKMVFTRAGKYKNGLLNAAQLGGYDFRKMKIEGNSTISIKGLKLSDGSAVKQDILVVALPHPSALSQMDLNKEESDEDGDEDNDTPEVAEAEDPNPKASLAVNQKLEIISTFLEKHEWTIEADPGRVNKFAKGDKYIYGRNEIGPEYYDFGTPKLRMVSKSDAARMKVEGSANVIVIGTREPVSFDQEAIVAMTNAKTAQLPPENEMYTARPRTEGRRDAFDPGPNPTLAQLMKHPEYLSLEKIFKPKEGKTWEKDQIAAFNVKTHPKVGDFGHYRGKSKNVQAVILADPYGYDDLITSRALTGSRGQFLHGLMEDTDIRDDYFVLKTVPFGMDGATSQEWDEVYGLTEKYRSEILEKIIESNDDTIKYFIADGIYAAKAFAKILATIKPNHANELIVIARDPNLDKKDFGIEDAAKKISKTLTSYKPRMANMPRTHLSYYARNWEGTSGDRVLEASDGLKGLAFAEVVPKWAVSQKIPLLDYEDKGIKAMLETLEKYQMQRPGEKITDYLTRINAH